MKHILILLSLAITTALCTAQETPNANMNQQGKKATSSESPASNAQTPGSSGKQRQSAAGQSSNSAQPQTISGCLNQSGRDYTLTDSQTGTVYQLSGNTSHLSSHVGHEMQITGQAKNGTNKSGTGAPSGNSGTVHVFDVSSTKHLADQCGPSGSTANGPSL